MAYNNFVIRATFLNVLLQHKHVISRALCDLVTHDKYSFIGVEATEKGFMFKAVPLSVLNKDAVLLTYAAEGSFKKIFESSINRLFRPASFINKLFPDKWDLPTINKWVDEMAAVLNPPAAEYKIVSGRELVESYHEDNYFPVITDGSTLHKSCMRYDKYQHLLALYKDHPDYVQSVVGYRADKVVARALLWRAEIFDWYTPTNKYVTVLDRRYSVSPRDEAALTKWAEDHCDYIRMHAEKYWTESKNPGPAISLHLRVPINYTNYTAYPYLDTFHYAYNNHLSNVAPVDKYITSESKQLKCADGTYKNIIPWDNACLDGQPVPDNALHYRQGRVLAKKYLVLHDTRYVPNPDLRLRCDMCKMETHVEQLREIHGYKVCYGHVVVPTEAPGVSYCTRHKVSIIGFDCGYCDGRLKACNRCHQGGKVEATNNTTPWANLCTKCVSEVSKMCISCYKIIPETEDSTEHKVWTGCRICIICSQYNNTMCVNCEGEFDRAQTFEINDDFYCQDCSEELFHYCEGCDYYVDDTTTVRGTSYCDGCLEDRFIACGRCGNYEGIDYVAYIESIGDDLCRNCVDQLHRCDRCDQLYDENDFNAEADACLACAEILINAENEEV